MQVDFYHLTTSPLERVLPRICGRVLAGGGRLLVVSGEETQRTGLDRLLWTYQADSFLPHGCAGGADEAGQPILIAAEPEPANGARNVALADGVWRAAALSFERVFHFFDAERIEPARVAWRQLTSEAEVVRRYWRLDERDQWRQIA